MINNDSFARLSRAIEYMRFPLFLSIIFYHAYIAMPISGHSAYYQFIYPFSLWIGETGVPAFFFVSGLWFFYSSKTYGQKIKSRVKTLVVPYFIWNSIMLAAFIIAFLLGFKLIIYEGRGIADYGFVDYIRAFWDRGDWDHGNGKPIYPPMWFLRNLMILCIFSPAIKFIIEKTGLLLPVAAGIVWLFINDMGANYECLSSFCLGAYFPIKKVNPIDILDKYKTAAIVLFIGMGLADWMTHTLLPCPYNLAIHRLAIFTNILCIPLIGSFLVDRQIRTNSLAHMAFFIYCVHLPIVSAIRKPALRLTELSSLTHVVIYLISVAVITLICIGLYKICERLIPTLLRISTGNRDKTRK